jgi:NADP-reducing hydrogenase subunit HndB
MSDITLEKLKKIKEQTLKKASLDGEETNVRIIVYMGTCGIAAGAEEIMKTLVEEKKASGRDDIKIVASGCMGMCSTEPNFSVEIKGEEPIVYRNMDRNMTRQVFKRHVLNGEVQTGFALGRV